jgi:uncharacterized protein (DUF1697 family)
MGVILSLLRGVNVGGHNKINMGALRILYESLDLKDPHTYVQSGNVVFKTEERDLFPLAKRIEEVIERSFGFRPQVILRTCEELRDVAAKNPFASRSGIDPSKLLVTFLASEPNPEARDALFRINAHPEELRINGRELYIYFPDGMGRAKLSPALIEKTLKISGTGRNWNSVTKLLAMAERLEACQ